MNNRIRILHIANTGVFSGGENVICQIITMFKPDKNYEMFYCSLDGQIRTVLEEKGISFVSVKKVSAKEIKKVIKDIKPNVIHAHDMKASFVASLACKKIPLVCHIHNNAYKSRKISLKSMAFLLPAKKAKHIFWVSESSYNGYFFHRFFKKKSEILYNVIDVEELRSRVNISSSNYSFDVLYLGRLTYQKNPLRLMDVCKRVLEKKSDINIGIVGTGDMEEETKEYAKKIGIFSRISFLGYLNNPARVLNNSKVLLMTSFWEGTPMCALEAMALGVPIVSTPVDGLKSLIENGENGFLSNDDDTLAKETIELISNKALFLKMSDNQKKKSNEWNDMSIYKNRIVATYESLMITKKSK